MLQAHVHKQESYGRKTLQKLDKKSQPCCTKCGKKGILPQCSTWRVTDPDTRGCS